MLSLIHFRRTADRLLALILLWNAVAGAVVTLGAPWLAELAGVTGLRQPSALPAGSGWLAIGVPTHYAGIWLSIVALYALHRMRRHLQWHLLAIAFYAPQTFAIASPLHLDMWVGLYAATSFQPTSAPAFALNWIAIALLVAHAGLGLSGSRFRVHLEKTPVAVAGLWRDFWGSPPLSRSALSRRYASIATLAAVIFLPLVPADAFYQNNEALEFVSTQYFSAWFEKDDMIFWRLLLLLPVTFVAAYAMAFVWSGGQREPRFSAGRGIVAALLTYVYLAMAADLLSRWLSDAQSQLFRLFMVAWIFLLPMMLLIPATGATAGAWLGRKTGAHESGRRLSLGMWLTLATPLLALLLSHVLDAPQRNQIDAARAVARSALEHFDRNEPDRLYEMFTSESRSMVDRAAFIAMLRERRESLGGLQAGTGRSELRHDWYPNAGIIEFAYDRSGTRGRSSEAIVIDVHGQTPTVAAVFMSFEGRPPADNVFVPRRDCGRGGRTELLHCAGLDDPPPRSLF